MKLRVALTTTDLSSLDHKQALISSPSPLEVQIESERRVKTVQLAAGQVLRITPKGAELDILVGGIRYLAARVVVNPVTAGR